MKKLLKTGALAAVLATGAIGATTTTASADVACNQYGDCWHVNQRYDAYPTTLGITFFGDDWRAAHRHDRQYHWRANRRDDHGYYDHGRWRRFDNDHH